MLFQKVKSREKKKEKKNNKIQFHDLGFAVGKSNNIHITLKKKKQ